MTSTVFVDQVTPVPASWLNDVNTATYTTVPPLAGLVAGAAQKSNNLSDLANLTTARTNLGAAASGANSDITSLASPAIAAATAATQAPGDNSTKVATTAYADAAASILKQIQPLSASVAANALTISASALLLEFRSTTLGSGTVSRVAGTPSNLIVPSTATLGTVSAQVSRLVILALNNAGTIELAVVNIAGGNDLTETGLINTTAISAAATAANVIYSTTARTGVAYRVIGYVESTQAAAGTWATAPSTIQGVGGQALIAMSSLGYGQTWQNVVGSRSIGTTFFNTTGKPIAVGVTAQSGTANTYSSLTVNGVIVCQTSQATGVAGGPLFGIVPPGGSYVVNIAGGTPTIVTWAELR